MKKEVADGNNTKKKKALWDAYLIAAEQHDLAYFKEMLQKHEAALQEETTKLEQDEAEKQEKKEKAAKRKSIATADEDVEMEDAADDGTVSAKKAKVSKKRKKETDSDGEPDKVR